MINTTKATMLAETKRAQREVDYEDAANEISEKMVLHGNKYVEETIETEFWEHLSKELESWSKLQMTENEKIVYDAVRTLFNSADELDILNKKAVYLYLREITGLNTKQIVSQLNKMRKRYKNFKTNWDNCKFQEISNYSMSKLEKYIEEAIQNIREDREITRELLDDAVKYLAKDESRHRDIGLIIAKYVETLQRSNEQLVKVSGLISKSTKSEGLSAEELEGIYSAIDKEEKDG